MRERLQGRGRILIMSGGALLIAVVLGVLWGFADTTGLADADNDTSTTTTSMALASGETTTTTDDPNNGADPDQPDPGGTTSTTAAPGSGGSGSSGGSGGGSATTAPQNRPPIIVDAGQSSNGLTLSITPTVTDPDGDDVAVTLTVDGQGAEPTDGTVMTTFGLGDVGYSHTATIEIRATDTAGNETVRTFTHRVEAVTTVLLRNIRFQVNNPLVCFEDSAAVRIAGNLVLEGTIDTTENSIQFSEELRPDRTVVTLHDDISGQTVGGPGGLDLTMVGGLAGMLDLYEASHSSSAIGVASMFEGTECQGAFSYLVQVTTE